MRAFLKWLLFVSVMSIGIVGAYVTGHIGGLISEDMTYIVVAIMSLFVGATVWCGYGSWRADDLSSEGSKKAVKKCIERCSFASAAFVTLGFIGTVIGFREILPILGTIDPSNKATMGAALSQLSGGIGTALSTTLVGLVCSFCLRVQNFNLTETLNQHDEDIEVMS